MAPLLGPLGLSMCHYIVEVFKIKVRTHTHTHTHTHIHTHIDTHTHTHTHAHTHTHTHTRNRPEQMTKEVWDYVFYGGDLPQSSDIPSEALK